jgi:hypothetical protein
LGGSKFKPAQANISQNNRSKMDQRCGSSGRTPALQVQSPEIKPQSHKKRKSKVALRRSWTWWHTPLTIALGRLKQEEKAKEGGVPTRI